MSMSLETKLIYLNGNKSIESNFGNNYRARMSNNNYIKIFIYLVLLT